MINYKTYEAFGDTMLDTLGETRQGYIGKEKDIENSLGDHSVLKYDYETGGFNLIAPCGRNIWVESISENFY